MSKYATAQPPQQQQLNSQQQIKNKINSNVVPMKDSTNLNENQRIKPKVIGNQDHKINQHDVQQLRISTIGVIQDTEQEDYEKYKQFTNDYLHEDLPQQQIIQMNYKQQQHGTSGIHTNVKKLSLQTQEQTKLPTPLQQFNVQMASTPTSMLDIKNSQQNPMMILNSFNMQQHQRNPNLNFNNNQGFKSHQLPNQTESTNILKGKKKSISITNSYSSNNGTFSNTNISNNTKRQSNNNENIKINSIINSGNTTVNQTKAYTQAHTANTSKEPHKKTQSLYNKKIVDIITGLQQSLGVIANNVQNSFNNNQTDGSIGNSCGPLLKGDQQKALLESALLAQKIAQMTSGLRKDNIVTNSNHIKKNSHIENMGQQINSKEQSNKRKSMKINSNLSGRGSLISAPKYKQGLKTLEDTQNEKQRKMPNPNRMSMDFQQNKKSAQLQRKVENSQTIDNTIMSDTLAAKYRSAMTNPQSSNHSSNITNTIDYPRQSVGNSLQRKHTATISSGERLSEANYISKNFKKPEQLLIQPNQDPQYEIKLKSAASSPSLTQLNQQKQNMNNAQKTSSGQLLKRKVHQQSQSNTIFDFGSQQIINNITTAQLHMGSDKSKPINQKKKNLIIAQKKDSATTKSEQIKNNNHKRATSDGSSLTKMFHFKQQMLINKIFQQQQLNIQGNQAQQQQQQQQPPITSTALQKNQRQSLGKNNQPQQVEKDNKQQKKGKVQVISSLSSKRLSYEIDNQENIVTNINYQSPRAFTAINPKQQQQQSSSQVQNNKIIHIQPDVKLSQDMKSFLEKFKTSKIDSQTSDSHQNQQKQLLIQAITHQQAINNQGMIQKQQLIDDNSYMTQKVYNNKQQSNAKIQSNLTSEKKTKDLQQNYNSTFDPHNKRQSQQIQRAHQVIQSHKRAKSDATKQSAKAVNHAQHVKAQQIISQANQSKQKMFFLSLNQQQTGQQYNQTNSLLNSQDYNSNSMVCSSKQPQRLNNNQNTMYNENYQLMPYNYQANNFVYSARASPSRKNNIYYNLEENQQQNKQQLNSNINTNSKPYLPTARSDSSTNKLIKNGISNQTTQKKICQSTNINNNRLIESVNTRLIYPEQNIEQLIMKPNQNYGQTNILQSQQFTKLASILNGENQSSQNNQYKMNNGNNNLIYNTQDNINHNDTNENSIVYQHDKQHFNILSDKYSAKQNKHFFGSESSFSKQGGHHMDIKSVNQSPKQKIMPTPKLNQPGAVNQITNFYENLNQEQNIQFYQQQQQQEQIMNANFMINPKLQQQQQKLLSKPKVQEYKVLITEQDPEDIEINDKQNQQQYMSIDQDNIDYQETSQPIIQFNSNNLQGKSELEGNQFLTFESNLTSHTMMNNMTPRTRDRYMLIKQIKLSFNKLKEPIKTTADFYRIGKMLGKGAFGRVNLAIHKLCNQLVAVKSINKQFLSEDESSKQKMMQEVLILQKTRHDNLVRLYDSFETNKHVVFVMELCAGGDLLNYVRKRRKLKEPVAKYVFKQVVDGLHYCHQKGIVHRDMKLDNLLFDEQGVVKICDFGVSKLLTSPNEIMTEQCGTPAYIAPEILKDKGYKGFGVDIWSLGVCLYAMLFGTVPFKANNMGELHQLIMKAKYSFKEDVKNGESPLSEDVKNLIKHLLEPNPDKRITMKGILNHKWMQNDPNEEQNKIEIFSEQELETIRKDFTYQDMSRYKRNQALKKKIDQQNQQHLQQNPHNNPQLGVGGVVTTEENLFTEHALDSTQNVLMRNCSTKSVVLAPFNSTRSHIAREDMDQDLQPPIGSASQENGDGDSSRFIPPLPIDPAMIVDKRIIKYAPRVKDINRQYEMNNNCDVDNGVYNKFVKQSTDGGKDDGIDSDRSKSDNSLVTSMNGDYQENLLENNPQGEEHQQYAAPLVSQNSDQEAEAQLMKQQQKCTSQQLNYLHNQMHTFLQQQHTQHGQSEFSKNAKDEPILIDYEVVERVEQYGYPRQYIITSIEQFDMNDAATNYYLLDKEKQQIDDYNYTHQFQ